MASHEDSDPDAYHPTDSEEEEEDFDSDDDYDEYEYGTGPWVPPDLNNIQPYMFEPMRKKGDKSSSDEETKENDERIGNTDWCKCGHCQPMTTAYESRCCHDIRKVKAKVEEFKENGVQCITDHPSFSVICLNETVLMIAYNQYKCQHDDDYEDEPIEERNKFCAYRQLIYWCWEYMGKKVRVPLPSCALNKIRSTFKSADKS